MRRIAFPFTAQGLLDAALRAALRLARAEAATLVPVYLAVVPRQLPLDCALPTEAAVALPPLEAIEHRATRAGVEVDSRIERGRTVRHALSQLMAHERYDRMVVAAGPATASGFSTDDVAWLLENAAGEILVLRPYAEETDASASAAAAGHRGQPALAR